MKNKNVKGWMVKLCLLIAATNANAQSKVDRAWVEKKPVQTSTDLFIMPGTDFVRPGLGTRANLNIGIGHTFEALKKSPMGDEVTFGYTYENAGGHGFWYTGYGSHTEALGLMKNVNFNTKLGGYWWSQEGITSLTGVKGVQNRVYSGQSIGLVIHMNPHTGIWIQESYNKINTVPWYTSTNVGYVISW